MNRSKSFNILTKSKRPESSIQQDFNYNSMLTEKRLINEMNLDSSPSEKTMLDVLCMGNSTNKNFVIN